MENGDEKLKDILNQILLIKISQMSFEKTLKLKNMSEYNFEVFKLKVVLQSKKEIEMYLKLVKKTKIKESVFCYWCLLYEEEILNNQKEIKLNNYTNKVLISELEKKKYYQSIFLRIDNNISKLIENGTEINFVDVKKYIIEKKLEKEYLEILECFNQDEDYELLVGIKKDTP